MQNDKLVIKNLTKLYKNKDGKLDGVENINLTVKEGELVTMLGPSGCGKTTILRNIGGFLEPDSGEIILDGVNIAKMPPEKRPTCMVFQSYNLWPHMTVNENLAFGLKLRKVPKNEIDKKIKEGLKLVSLEDMGSKYPAQLSGGQQQRVAIARALILQPSLLLLDEPFSALDAKIRMQMREELKKIQLELGITVVFVTHDQEEAMSISDRIIVMSKGKFEQIGTPAEVYDTPKTKFVASFIGNMNFIDTDNNIIASRPENITISKTEKSELVGKIRTMMILGHFLEINVDTNKAIVKCFMPRSASDGYAPGDEVFLNIKQHIVFSKDV